MNWDRIERDWKRFKIQAKRNWDRLSENELRQVNGDREALCSKVRQAYGIGRSEAELQIDEWVASQDQRVPTEQPAASQTQRQSSY